MDRGRGAVIVIHESWGAASAIERIYVMSLQFTRRASGILAGGLLLGCSGCVFDNQALSQMTAEDVHKKLQVGKTSESDVNSLLGEPRFKGVDKDSVLWQYHYQKAPAIVFVPLIGLLFGQKVTEAYLIVGFDDNHVINDVKYSGSK